jgi:hypothetical protein
MEDFINLCKSSLMHRSGMRELEDLKLAASTLEQKLQRKEGELHKK